MPATYHVIPGNVWTRTFRRLSLEGKVVAFNVWTSPLRLSEGLFELSAVHVAADTGLTVDQVDAALAELGSVGLLEYDADAELVLVPEALKASPLRHSRDADGNIAVRKDGSPKLDKRIRPAVQKFRQLPESPLKAKFVRLAWEHSPDLAEAIGEVPTQPPMEGASKGPMEDPSTSTSTSTSTSHENEAKHEAEHEASHENEASSSTRSYVTRCGVCGEVPGWCTCEPTEPQAEPAAERSAADVIKAGMPWAEVS